MFSFELKYDATLKGNRRFLLSLTKNCETLSEQSHRKAEETLEFKMNKPRGHCFKPPSEIKGDWMIELTDLEVYNSIFNLTQENNKFELYKFLDEKIGGISYTKVRVEIEKDLVISDITATNIQDETIAPIIIKEYRDQLTKRMNDDHYMYKLSGSIIQVFDGFFRTEAILVEDDFKLVSDEYNSSFII